MYAYACTQQAAGQGGGWEEKGGGVYSKCLKGKHSSREPSFECIFLVNHPRELAGIVGGGGREGGYHVNSGPTLFLAGPLKSWIRP